jgi:hypothetical protein
VKPESELNTEINLLDLIPEKNIEWEKNEEGLIVLLKPKYKNPFLAKHLLPRLKNPYYRVKLDAVGSFIWELCDGHSTVKELGRKLKDKFKDKVEPLYDRLGLFLQNLEKNHFICYKNFQR